MKNVSEFFFLENVSELFVMLVFSSINLGCYDGVDFVNLECVFV